MSVADRDYMKKASDDLKKIEAYEKAAREQEYGDFDLRRTYPIQKYASVIIVIIVLLTLIAFVSSFI